jgi:hypothetical protein
MKYKVLFTKHFTSGSLAGLTFDDSVVCFPSLDLACQYVTWLHKHSIKPVVTRWGSSYTCHGARVIPMP